MEGGGQAGPSNPTDAERLQQARELYEQMREKADRLEQEVQNLKKKENPGRDPLRRHGLRTDRSLLPQPDDYEGLPSHGPSGTYPHD